MSDDLVKDLRTFADDGYPDLTLQAADRIEELENRLEKEMSDLDAADRRITRLQARIEELEAKLAKAIEIIEAYRYEDGGYIPSRVSNIYDELKGEKID